MAKISFSRVSALPAVLTAETVYFVSDTEGNRIVITGTDPAIQKVIASGHTEEELQTMLDGLNIGELVIDEDPVRKFDSYKTAIHKLNTQIDLLGGSNNTRWKFYHQPAVDIASSGETSLAVYGDGNSAGVGCNDYQANPLDQSGNVEPDWAFIEGTYAWPFRLKEYVELANIYTPFTANILNASWATATVSDGWALANLDNALFSPGNSLDPSLIFLSFGIGDVLKRGADFNIADFRSEYINLVNELHRRGYPVIIIGVGPTSHQSLVKNTHVTMINSTLEDVASVTNTRFIPMYQPVSDWLSNSNNQYSFDWKYSITDAGYYNEVSSAFVAGILMHEAMGISMEAEDGRQLAPLDPRLNRNPTKTWTEVIDAPGTRATLKTNVSDFAMLQDCWIWNTSASRLITSLWVGQGVNNGAIIGHTLYDPRTNSSSDNHYSGSATPGTLIVNAERQLTSTPMPIGLSRFATMVDSVPVDGSEVRVASLLVSKHQDTAHISGFIVPQRGGGQSYVAYAPKLHRAAVPSSYSFYVNIEAEFTANESGIIVFHAPSISSAVGFSNRRVIGGIGLFHVSPGQSEEGFKLRLFAYPEDRAVDPVYIDIGALISYSDIGFDNQNPTKPLHLSVRFGSTNSGADGGTLVEVFNRNRVVISTGVMPAVADYRGGWMGGVIDSNASGTPFTSLNRMSLQVLN